MIWCSTSKIKALADVRPIAIDDADSLIRSFHLNLQNDNDQLNLQNDNDQLNLQNGNEASNGIHH